ncbi:hypothetical protein [Paractinoplanes durhamensis]|uniref:Uncharacterized protein n=1 Tax=Paractinoplanes durhamensis TaxID=113563 RepID=A0ABQ3YWI9_9ACTN|nr:hypothetical protein [Actinoplanes durhamensis]GIE01900.1 hypothetical protein Adu01nite_32500 [Actinoplanes durhamensis]
MTDLDELKHAMDAPPDFEPVVLDLHRVMVAGRRVRRRRRAAGAAASGVAVAALLVVGGQLMSPAGTGAIDAAGYSAPSGAVPSAINSSAPGILGRVVETGRQIDGKQWIIYAETVDPDQLNLNLTLVLGRTRTGYINDFTKDIISSDQGATRMAEGFHAVKAGTVIDGRTTPTFGYYKGEPARITARVTGSGKTVEAHLTAWSGFAPTEKAQIFWFDFTQGQAPAQLTDLTAYDRDGKTLG